MAETTPDTLGYLILGLVIAFGIMAAFVSSMIARHRNLQKDAELLRQLGDEE
jgi:hypothetical protein